MIRRRRRGDRGGGGDSSLARRPDPPYSSSRPVPRHRSPETPITVPVTRSERIVAIDVLRGFAVLGILIVNIQGFARVASAYMNPASGRVLQGADLWTWGATYLFADTKFISIFSLLFGAGIAMMSERAAKRGVSAACSPSRIDRPRRRTASPHGTEGASGYPNRVRRGGERPSSDPFLAVRPPRIPLRLGPRIAGSRCSR